MTIYTKYEEIPRLKYSFIMADPPWVFKNFSAKGEVKNPVSQYKTRMSLDLIRDMNVGHLAKPDCILWLWATNPMLDVQIDVLKAWGFTFKTSGHWAKMTKHNKQFFGTGYCLRGAGEPFLIGTIGKPKFTNGTRSVVIAKVRENSRKPDEAYTAAENLSPDATRLDLFSREVRDGWDCFGDEIGKFTS